MNYEWWASTIRGKLGDWLTLTIEISLKLNPSYQKIDINTNEGKFYDGSPQLFKGK